MDTLFVVLVVIFSCLALCIALYFWLFKKQPQRKADSEQTKITKGGDLTDQDIEIFKINVLNALNNDPNIHIPAQNTLRQLIAEAPVNFMCIMEVLTKECLQNPDQNTVFVKMALILLHNNFDHVVTQIGDQCIYQFIYQIVMDCMQQKPDLQGECLFIIDDIIKLNPQLIPQLIQFAIDLINSKNPLKVLTGLNLVNSIIERIPRSIQSNLIPPNLIPPNLIPPNLIPPNLIPPNLIPLNLIPLNLIPLNLIPPNLIPLNLIPPNLIPPNLIPQEIIQEFIPQEIIQEFIPQEIIPRDIISQYIPQEFIPQFIPQEFIPLLITPNVIHDFILQYIPQYIQEFITQYIQQYIPPNIKNIVDMTLNTTLKLAENIISRYHNTWNQFMCFAINIANIPIENKIIPINISIILLINVFSNISWNVDIDYLIAIFNIIKVGFDINVNNSLNLLSFVINEKIPLDLICRSFIEFISIGIGQNDCNILILIDILINSHPDIIATPFFTQTMINQLFTIALIHVINPDFTDISLNIIDNIIRKYPEQIPFYEPITKFIINNSQNLNVINVCLSLTNILATNRTSINLPVQHIHMLMNQIMQPFGTDQIILHILRCFNEFNIIGFAMHTDYIHKFCPTIIQMLCNDFNYYDTDDAELMQLLIDTHFQKCREGNIDPGDFVCKLLQILLNNCLRFVNPEVLNPEVFNPEVFNPEVFNPEIFDPEDYDPEVFNPEVFNPEVISILKNILYKYYPDFFIDNDDAIPENNYYPDFFIDDDAIPENNFIIKGGKPNQIVDDPYKRKATFKSELHIRSNMYIIKCVSGFYKAKGKEYNALNKMWTFQCELYAFKINNTWFFKYGVIANIVEKGTNYETIVKSEYGIHKSDITAAENVQFLDFHLTDVFTFTGIRSGEDIGSRLHAMECIGHYVIASVLLDYARYIQQQATQNPVIQQQFIQLIQQQQPFLQLIQQQPFQQPFQQLIQNPEFLQFFVRAIDQAIIQAIQQTIHQVIMYTKNLQQAIFKEDVIKTIRQIIINAILDEIQQQANQNPAFQQRHLQDFMQFMRNPLILQATQNHEFLQATKNPDFVPSTKNREFRNNFRNKEFRKFLDFIRFMQNPDNQQPISRAISQLIQQQQFLQQPFLQLIQNRTIQQAIQNQIIQYQQFLQLLQQFQPQPQPQPQPQLQLQQFLQALFPQTIEQAVMQYEVIGVGDKNFHNLVGTTSFVLDGHKLRESEMFTIVKGNNTIGQLITDNVASELINRMKYEIHTNQDNIIQLINNGQQLGRQQSTILVPLFDKLSKLDSFKSNPIPYDGTIAWNNVNPINYNLDAKPIWINDCYQNGNINMYDNGNDGCSGACYLIRPQQGDVIYNVI